MSIDVDARQLLLETVDRLIRDRIAPRAASIDATGEFPRDVFEAMGEIGLLGLWVPEQLGGLETDLRTSVLILERIGRASATCALILSSCYEATFPIISSGSESVRSEYLPKIATGEMIPCFALTEPGAGSDAASIATRAVRDGDGYRLSGQKVFCTNGSVGGLYVVFSKTDPSAGSRGLSVFVVPREAIGLSIGRDEDLIGLRGSPTSEIILDNVWVPEDARLGEEGKGWDVAMTALNEARLNAAAVALGIAKSALNHAVEYAKQRHQFGTPIIQHEGLAFLLADMTTGVAAGWALFQQALEMLEREPSPNTYAFASMAKLFCTDVTMKVTVDAVQVFGGYGLTKGFPVERLMRDAKAFQIFDGTNQIQRMIIGKYLEKAGIPVARET